MVMNQKIIVRLTDMQNQLIKGNAERLGYKSKSDYARDLILKDNLIVEKMVDEIWKKVCNE